MDRFDNSVRLLSPSTIMKRWRRREKGWRRKDEGWKRTEAGDCQMVAVTPSDSPISGLGLLQFAGECERWKRSWITPSSTLSAL